MLSSSSPLSWHLLGFWTGLYGDVGPPFYDVAHTNLHSLNCAWTKAASTEVRSSNIWHHDAFWLHSLPGLQNPWWFWLPFCNLIIGTACPSVLGSLVLTPLHCVSIKPCIHQGRSRKVFPANLFFYSALATIISDSTWNILETWSSSSKFSTLVAQGMWFPGYRGHSDVLYWSLFTNHLFKVCCLTISSLPIHGRY